MFECLEKFEKGFVKGLESKLSIEELPWTEHAAFKGVYLKHLIKGAETNGQLSCHLVHIKPMCIIDWHIHEGKLEVHEVLDGSGEGWINELKLDYRTGSVALIPAGINHKVVAGNEGLFILAKFSSALL